MDAIRKSHEIQLQVRNNAEEVRNTLNDLYSWELEMKAKEKELHRRPESTELKEQKDPVPIRSHIVKEKQLTDKEKQEAEPIIVANENNGTPTTSTATTPTEKIEKPVDANEEKRKQANEFKDKGNKYVKLCKYEEAIQEYTLAIDIFPEDSIYYSNRALCSLKLEKYNDCIEDCERAIEIDSLAVKAHYRRMQANECLGNNMDALRDCTTVLMIEPKNSEAKRSLERINNRLRKSVKSSGPNFSEASNNKVQILPIDKPPYKRSTKPLRRVFIADVVGPKDTKNCENSNLKISDDDIDKLFNSNCGPFVEIKNPSSRNVDNQPINQTYKGLNKLSTNTNQIKDIQKSEYNQKNRKKTNTEYNAKAGVNVLLRDANRPLPPSPSSTAQFYSNWKELTPAQKYQYLKSIEISQLCKILGAGFDSDTLTDILYTLRDFYLTNRDATTASTLLEISKNSQVAILSLLMSTEEQKIVTDIIASINGNKESNLVAEKIRDNFNLL